MKRVLLFAALFFAVFTGIYFLRGSLSDGVEMALVQNGSAEDAIFAEGVLIKSESLVLSPAAGAFAPAIAEGERVAKGAAVGAVYAGAVDEAAQNELAQVNRRIEQIEASRQKSFDFGGDVSKLEVQIGAELAELTDSAYRRDMRRVAQGKSRIESLIEKKAVVSGQKSAATDTLAELKAKKSELEARAGVGRTELYAPVGGVFSARLDDFETILTPKTMANLKAADFEKIHASKPYTPEPKPQTPLCKIIDNYAYYAAFALDEKSVFDISAGSALRVRFTEVSPDLLDASVVSIAPPEDGKVLVTLSLTRAVGALLSLRAAEADIVKRTYEGLRVPVAALRTENGGQGVYVKRGGVMRFAPVAVLYSANDWVLIDAALSGTARLYDEVVVKAPKLADGEVIAP